MYLIIPQLIVLFVMTILRTFMWKSSNYIDFFKLILWPDNELHESEMEEKMGVTSFISKTVWKNTWFWKIGIRNSPQSPGFLAKNIKEESKEATYFIVFCISGPVVLKIILQMLPSVEVFTKLNPLWGIWSCCIAKQRAQKTEFDGVWEKNFKLISRSRRDVTNIGSRHEITK